MRHGPVLFAWTVFGSGVETIGGPFYISKSVGSPAQCRGLKWLRLVARGVRVVFSRRVRVSIRPLGVDDSGLTGTTALAMRGDKGVDSGPCIQSNAFRAGQRNSRLAGRSVPLQRTTNSCSKGGPLDGRWWIGQSVGGASTATTMHLPPTLCADGSGEQRWTEVR